MTKKSGYTEVRLRDRRETISKSKKSKKKSLKNRKKSKKK